MKINTRRMNRFPYGPYAGYGRYGDVSQDAVQMIANVSPWNAIVAGFQTGAQSSKDKAAQALAVSQTAQTKSETAVEIAKYAAMGVAAFIGGLALITWAKRK